MNIEVECDNEVERNNTSNMIVVVLSEEANGLKMVQKIISYSEVVQTGSGKNTALSIHSPHKRVEEP